MLRQIKWTLLSLVVKHVEIVVFLVVVDQRRQYLLFAVRIRTVLLVRTLTDTVGKVRTKLLLVLLGVVVFFD